MNHREIVEALRAKMRAAGMHAYVLTMGDYHGSEYVSDYFRAIAFVSGFTGSAGTLILTEAEAALWTDGRYHLQAQRQLEGSGIVLYPDGKPGVIKPEKYLQEKLPDGAVLGFNGRVVPTKLALAWEKKLEGRGIHFACERDLVGELWQERPAQAFHAAWKLDEHITGETATQKLARVRKALEEAGAEGHILTSLDDIAWLLNVRGDDVECNPVVFSFVTVTKEDAVWYVQRDAVPAELQAELAAAGYAFRPYEAIWEDVKTFAPRSVLVDPTKICYYLYAQLPEGCKRILQTNPTTLMKCLKNEAEQEALRRSHKADGIAMVKFLYWLKHHPAIEFLSELDAQEYLAQRRYEQGAFELSFGTICAYGPNAAMMHYSATPEKYSMLQPKGFLLVDSGGQYKDGTTDITRTITLGELTEEEKISYTATLRAVMRLARARFLEGCTGYHLDILARGPVWDLGLDYRCGTGHGVGMCLNVHEGPNGFRWLMPDNRNEMAILHPGMVTTDEPGVYIDDRYGIRIENELLCLLAQENEYGRFLRFETITMCPIDLEPVLKERMMPDEIAMLNAYHETVYQTLKDGLTAEEAAWLREVTLPL